MYYGQGLQGLLQKVYIARQQSKECVHPSFNVKICEFFVHMVKTPYQLWLDCFLHLLGLLNQLLMYFLSIVTFEEVCLQLFIYLVFCKKKLFPFLSFFGLQWKFIFAFVMKPTTINEIVFQFLFHGFLKILQQLPQKQCIRIQFTIFGRLIPNTILPPLSIVHR